MQSFLRRHRNNSGLFPISEVEEQRRFKPDKKMGAKEQILLTMLQDKNADNNPPVNFVITDPDFIDNPIIYASDGFCAFTGYHKKEIEQRNCRFLQGSDTDKEEVAKIRRAIDEERDETVELLNYKKDGTPFRNRFFLCPLYKPDRKIAYYLGVQLDITNEEHDDIHENAGARLFGWLQ
jgi:PAS domain S-box-containing protein